MITQVDNNYNYIFVVRPIELINKSAKQKEKKSGFDWLNAQSNCNQDDLYREAEETKKKIFLFSVFAVPDQLLLNSSLIIRSRWLRKKNEMSKLRGDACKLGDDEMNHL